MAYTMVKQGEGWAVLRADDGTLSLLLDELPEDILNTIGMIAAVDELSLRVVALDWLERGMHPKRPREWPTKVMFEACVKDAGLRINAALLWSYYESTGWVNHRGEPIMDWLAAARAWAYIVSGMCEKDFDDLEPDDPRNCGRGYGKCRSADQGGAEGTGGATGDGGGAEGIDPESISAC